ncbi:MAG: SAM-dependent methyltransferase [Rhodospirillaceae bacterium]|nr:SAM-dependent methyltransferase [Rhodospirillaceae bacterium]
MVKLSDKALHFPATTRNRDVIARVLKSYLPKSGNILEIGSGSGEHGVFFSKLFPNLNWQLSDIDPLNLESIKAWIEYEGEQSKNIFTPLIVNASENFFLIRKVSAIICINVLHISPWNVTTGLMRNTGKLLPPGGVLYLYGPYKINGDHTSHSNELFDSSLRSENAQWGVRNLEDICVEAVNNNLVLLKRIEMPANNQSLIFHKKN